jgi:hypothetical protein
MTTENILQELERYRNELSAIMARFTPPTSSDMIHHHHINPQDDPRFRTFVIEIIDLLNDTIGTNKYSSLINQIFNEGISNYYQSPSITSVQNIISVLDSVVTWLKRNPDVCTPKKEIIVPEKKAIDYPEKITLKWLRDHVPAYYFWSLVLILFFMFCLGLKFADTKLYKSLIETYTANDNTIKKTTMPNK